MAVPLRQSRLPNVQASCFAYDATSGYVIFPGRRAFSFFPTNEPDFPSYASYSLRQTAVADATKIYCNPEIPSQFVIVRSQCLELYEFRKSHSNTETCSKKVEVQAHTKAIDDISWCPSCSNWLVSCSRDQYAILWDIPRAEAVTNFRATSPFTCCCWLNYGRNVASSPESKSPSSPISSPQMSGYVVVASADSRLLFWDVRAGNRPAIVVQAHSLRIHALDSGSAANEQYLLATAADGDARMALWDVRNLDRKLSSIESPFGTQPPRKIRFSPSGGMLLVTASTMPRPATIDEPKAAVISLTESTGIMLSGHLDHVYDALWTSSDRILTWSQDFYIREFQIAAKQVLLTPTSSDSSAILGISSSFCDLGNHSRDSTPSTPPTLRPPVDSQHSSCGGMEGTGSSALSSTPAQLPVISPLVPIPQPPPLPTHVVSSTNLAGPGSYAIQFHFMPNDYSIPSPRTAGARFCAAGFLVSLHRRYELKTQTSNRALADFNKAIPGLSTGGGRSRGHRNRHISVSKQAEPPVVPFAASGSAITAGVLPNALSPSSGGLQTQNPAPQTSAGLVVDNNRQHSVVIYSVNALLKTSKELAIASCFDWIKPAECCRQNAATALSYNRPDLAQALSVAALVLDDASALPSSKADLVACVGRNALIRMFSHFIEQGCLQDAAMLAYFLSFTGINLNGSVGSENGPADSPRGVSPPASSGSRNNSLIVSHSGQELQHSMEDYIYYDHSYDHSLTVGPNFWRKMPIIQISTVKRSSSWNDVQNVSPDGTDSYPGPGDSRSHNETPLSRFVLPSPQRKIYRNRLIEMAVAKRRKQPVESEFPFQAVTTPYAGCSEALRLQMATVLRCFADQLQAWRLHVQRTALLRPLNAVTAAQVTPRGSSPVDTTNTDVMVALPPHPHTVIQKSNVVKGSSSNLAISGQIHRQISFDTSQMSASATSIGNGSNTGGIANSCNSTIISSLLQPAHQPSSSNLALHNMCSVCELPVQGLSTICLLCGHGGHSVHIREFFSSSTSNYINCPAGCGCRCPSLRVPLVEGP